MATKIGCSSSPFRYFQHTTNAKLRVSQFVDQQSVAHQTISDKDKSYGVPKSRGRLQKPQTALVVGSEDQSQISWLQRAPEDIFPIGNSCFHITGNDGKPVVSFCNRPFSRDNEVISSNSERTQRTWNIISWFIGPVVLAASFGFPLISLPDILRSIFGDTLLKIFLQTISTEAIFYCGVAVFLIVLDRLMRPKQLDPSANKSNTQTLQLARRMISSFSTVAVRQLSITIPLITMGMTWNAHIVPVTLAPYLVGVFVQLAFEILALYWTSPSWAAIPFIFHVYRLHQIQSASNMLTYVLFQCAKAEMANIQPPITASTWLTLTRILRLLLYIWIWSFSSFLMSFLLPSASATSSDANI